MLPHALETGALVDDNVRLGDVLPSLAQGLEVGEEIREFDVVLLLGPRVELVLEVEPGRGVLCEADHVDAGGGVHPFERVGGGATLSLIHID